MNTNNAEAFEELRKREEKEKAMGGQERVKKQHDSGKLTARERLELLFDSGSFEEINMFTRHRCTDFDMTQTFVAGEGVVTGYGRVNGRPVYAFSQDFTSMGGTLGEMHARKICDVMDLAVRSGLPIVGFNDSGGARIQEGVDSLHGYGEIFFRNTYASGVVPQISAIMGPCAGGAVYSPAMTDWVFMVRKTSYMFITGPDVIKAATGEDIGLEELGGAPVHATKSGVAHFACNSDPQAIEMIRALLGYLPSNCREAPPLLDLGDDPERTEPALNNTIPDDPRKGYDMKDVIRALVDKGQFLEPHAQYARNIIVCFARLNGKAVGIIANQPSYLAGCLDVDASDKASRFIRFCDAFNIPLVTIADVPGYLPGSRQEWAGIIRHGAKLLWSYSEATVPKITLITRKKYGGSYMAMCSRELGADFTFAWPKAEIAVMGAEGATNIIHRREINEADDPEAKRAEKMEEYSQLFNTPYIAAARGYVNAVILPRDTRPKLIKALEVLSAKSQPVPNRRHGNIPL
ncbi:acyl-CoA carboxylase subunit beta [Chloroflexota bacterium]